MSGLRSVTWAIPGDLDTPTGGYAYDRRVMQALTEQGWEVSHLRLGDSFPHPTPADLADTAHQLASLPDSTPVIIDGLAYGALDGATLDHVSAPIIALIHHPLALEGDLEQARGDELLHGERANLTRAAAIIVTSPATSRLLVDEYGVERERITIAEPGTDQPTRPHQPTTPPLILSVGSQAHRKGHDVLLAALARLTDLPWEAIIVGSVRDQRYSEQLRALLNTKQLGHRVTLTGALHSDQLDALYAQATVFALATRFEGYGMVFAEAMARGLPIVSCNSGAVAQTVARGAGILTEPEDPAAFARALRSVLTDDTLRVSMVEASISAGRRLPTWKDTATSVATVIEHTEGNHR